MGALDNTGDGRTFLNTFKGKFTLRANAETPNAVKRINKNNKEVYELHFDTLKDVVLQEIEKRESNDYGLSWNIKLAHAKSDETFTLTLPYSGRLTMGLFLRLPNIDLNKPMTMKLYYFEEDDRAALVIYQPEKVETFWSKDEPKELPELEEVMRNGKKEWDSTKRMAYLEAYIKKDVEPKLNDLGDMGAHDTEFDQTPPPEVEEQSVNQDPEPVTQEQPVANPNLVAAVEGVSLDPEHGVLKRKADDGNFYQCDAKGMFIKDKDGKNILVGLPF